ncbi:MAG: hypothetical protein P8J33_02570 [Pirellulaceae bacterium]|nr:hypothetical protein [Pirellulaceae bacterium]
MTALKGILYQSGNLDFPRSENEWAFARMRGLREDQANRIVMHPTMAPIELSISSELDPSSAPWLEPVADILNACSTVNLQLRESTLRLRKAICEIDNNHRLVVLVSQEAVDEFAKQYWGRIRYFYAHRFDGFRFNIGTLISSKQQAVTKGDVIEIQARVVAAEDSAIPTVTFDATGSTADVDLVEWRGGVKEGASGRFKHDNRDVQIAIPQTRQPLIFLHEKRPEFKSHAFMFNGEKFDKCLKRALKLAQQRSAED